ncbi:hypothetical protein PWT90_07861 [Aphanocladium album]|nr:hypothetical protein PWT90_07861 [Aphanocladium album]
MEALAIFGIVCNVLQVIGSVEQAIKLGRAIYKSGSLDPELERNIDTLSICIQDLRMSLESSADPVTHDTRELISVVNDCIECGAGTKSELQKIAALAPKGSSLGAVRGWLAATMGGKKRLDKLEKTMHARQSILETQLLVRLCKKADAAAIRDQNIFLTLNSALQSFIVACTQGRATLQQLIKIQSESIKAHVTDEAAKTRQANRSNIIQETRRIESGIFSTLHIMQAADISRQEREQLLASLSFATMYSRRNSISNPHSKTFDWVFGPSRSTPPESPIVEAAHSAGCRTSLMASQDDTLTSNEDSDAEPVAPWSNLTDWLRTNGHPWPYWVSGKAGSGKSTFMKFLVQNRRTLEALSSSGDSVKILSHYFWAPGDQLQRNITGFLCTILHELLTSNHSYCSSVISNFDFARSKREANNWAESELEATLCFVLSTSQTVYCIFLDGDSNVYTPQQTRMFLHRICSKADGVFLWVVLALKELELGTCYDEDFQELINRLDALPKDLEELYISMWKRENDRNPSHQKEASRYLNMLLLYESNGWYQPEIDILTMTLALNRDLAVATVQHPPESLASKLHDSCKLVERRMDLRTSGLVEIGKDHCIRLTHRSAYEFLRESTYGREILRTDDTASQELLSDFWCGLLASLAICLALPTKLYYYGGDYCHTKVDEHAINQITSSAPSATSEDFRSLCLLSQQYRGTESRLITLNEYLNKYKFSPQLVGNENIMTLSLAEVLYESGAWQWPQIIDQFVRISLGPQSEGAKSRPDFLGTAARVGFFHFVTVAMRRLYAGVPSGMQISRRYEDYIIRACVINTSHFRQNYFNNLQLSAIGLIELLTEYMSPNSSENSTSISKPAIIKFLKGADRATEGCDPFYLGRALVGLFYAKYSRAGDFVVRLGHPSVRFPRDCFNLAWVTEVAPEAPPGYSSSLSKYARGEYFFYCHTNAKTVLMLLLSGATNRHVKGHSIFSELYEAVGAMEMPFFLRAVAPTRHKMSFTPTTYLTEGNSACIYSDSRSIKLAMTCAEIRHLQELEIGHNFSCIVVVPGFGDYTTQVLPEMQSKDVIISDMEQQLIHDGLFEDTECHADWPPQPYVPINHEAGRA